MAVSIRSRSAAGVAVLAATTLALPAITLSTPVAAKAHTVAISSDAPARQFAVRLLGALEQLPVPTGAVAVPAAAAVPAASVVDIFHAVGNGIATTYMAGLNVVGQLLAGTYNVVNAIPLVNVLAPQIYLLTDPIMQVLTSAVLNTSMTVALMRDPITAFFNVVNSVVSAAVSFVVNEVNWALTAPGRLVGLAAVPAATTTTAQPAAAGSPATASTPEPARKARADKHKAGDRHRAGTPARTAVSAAATTPDDRRPVTDRSSKGRNAHGDGHRTAGKHARTSAGRH